MELDSSVLKVQNLKWICKICFLTLIFLGNHRKRIRLQIRMGNGQMSVQSIGEMGKDF